MLVRKLSAMSIKILYIRIQTNAAFSLNFEIVNHLKKVSPLVIGRTDLSYLSQG